MPRKIAIITDAHGNLPALDAALQAIAAESCDAIYHTGDAISVCPYSAEVVDRLLHTPNLHLIMVNHDEWFAFGLPEPQPDWMSDGALRHLRLGSFPARSGVTTNHCRMVIHDHRAGERPGAAFHTLRTERRRNRVSIHHP